MHLRLIRLNVSLLISVVGCEVVRIACEGLSDMCHVLFSFVTCFLINKHKNQYLTRV